MLDFLGSGWEQHSQGLWVLPLVGTAVWVGGFAMEHLKHRG